MGLKDYILNFLKNDTIKKSNNIQLEKTNERLQQEQQLLSLKLFSDKISKIDCSDVYQLHSDNNIILYNKTEKSIQFESVPEAKENPFEKCFNPKI